MSSPKTTECSFKISQKLPQRTSENRDEQMITDTHSLHGAASSASWGRVRGWTSHWRRFPGSVGTRHQRTPSEAEGYSAPSRLGSHKKGRRKRMTKRREVKSAAKRLVCLCGLTQESWVSVAQRKALVTGDAEGRQQVEAFVEERLQARGRRIGWMEQVINLLTGRTQSRHWRGEAKTHWETSISQQTEKIKPYRIINNWIWVQMLTQQLQVRNNSLRKHSTVRFLPVWL